MRRLAIIQSQMIEFFGLGSEVDKCHRLFQDFDPNGFRQTYRQVSDLSRQQAFRMLRSMDPYVGYLSLLERIQSDPEINDRKTTCSLCYPTETETEISELILSRGDCLMTYLESLRHLMDHQKASPHQTNDQQDVVKRKSVIAKKAAIECQYRLETLVQSLPPDATTARVFLSSIDFELPLEASISLGGLVLKVPHKSMTDLLGRTQLHRLLDAIDLPQDRSSTEVFSMDIHRKVESVINGNPDYHVMVDQQDILGRLPVMIACQKDLVDFIDLIDYNYSYESTDKKTALGHIPAHSVISPRQVEDYMNHESPLGWNLRDELGHTALFYAARKQHCDLIKWILSRKCLSWDIPENKHEPLIEAINRGHESVVRCIVDEGSRAYPNDPLLYDAPKTFRAVFRQDNLGILQYFCVEKAVPVNIQDTEGKSLLVMAIENKSQKCATYLLNHPVVDINLGDNKGRKPIVAAMERRLYHISHLLMKNPNLDFNASDDTGTTVLMHTIINKFFINVPFHPEIDINAQDCHGRTALMIAIERENLPAIQELLYSQFAMVNLQDHTGHTALSLAIRKGSPRMVRLLVRDSRVDVNTPDISGQTLLMAAIELGKLEIVRELSYSRSIDFSIRNIIDGMTALDIAQENGQDEIVEILEDAIDRRESLGLTLGT